MRGTRCRGNVTRVGRDGFGFPKNLGIGGCAYALPINLGTGGTPWDGSVCFGTVSEGGSDGTVLAFPKNLGIGGSAGTGRTGRFRPSEKFRDRRVGWDGSDGTVLAFRKI